MAAHLRLYWSVVVHAEFNCPKHALPVGFPAKHRVTGRLFVEYFQNRIREIAGDVLRAVFVPQFDHLVVTAGRIIQVRVSGPSRPQTFIVTGCAAHIQLPVFRSVITYTALTADRAVRHSGSSWLMMSCNSPWVRVT